MRRRSSKPLEIRARVESSVVGSGTAVSSLAAPVHIGLSPAPMISSGVPSVPFSGFSV